VKRLSQQLEILIADKLLQFLVAYKETLDLRSCKALVFFDPRWQPSHEASRRSSW
jgi:hypothetical protein